MRIASSALVTLLAIAATPSVGVAQVLDLAGPRGYHYSFDRQVPVATVSLLNDIVTLGGARIVRDPYGEPFVLGAATLDVSVPSKPKIVFKMTNPTEEPIRLRDVLVYARTMVSAHSVPGITVGAPYMPLSATGGFAGYYAPAGDELPPGASLTVEFSIPPPGCTKNGCVAAGFVVFVGRKLPHGYEDPTGRAWLGKNPPPPAYDATGPGGRAWIGDNPIFTRGFLALLSQTQRQSSSPLIPPQ